MKKLVLLLSLFGMILNSNAQKISNLPTGSTIDSPDNFVYVQGGTTKKLPYSVIGGVISDSSDILRAELPPLWRSDIADTATVLRVEIASAGTIDTAWARLDETVILKFITDSVGIGTTTPTEKLDVNGNIKALRGLFDNGFNNVLLGESSGESLTSGGTDNVFIGYQVAKDATQPTLSVGIGYQSLFNNEQGISNTAIGWQSGFDITTGRNNVLVGSASGADLTTGQFNVMLGDAAGQTSGASTSNDVRVGYFSGRLATGSNNVFVGFEAGENLTESGAVLIGSEAGEGATSAVGLTGIGFQSVANITTGDFITMGGYQAGDAITTSSFNTGWGYGVLSAITDQNSNTALGYQAGGSATAAGCIYLGVESGENNTTDNLLFIDVSNTASPLIWGDFTNNRIVINGNSTDNVNNRTFFSNGSAGGTTVWNNDSDSKLKKNIKPIKNALDKVMNLEGVEFEWKDKREPGQRIGFIAQDVFEVLPEVVTPGETYSMQTALITAVLVEALKEQQKQIDKLTKEINKLKK